MNIAFEKLRNSPIKPLAEFVAGIRSVGSANLTIGEGYFSPTQAKRAPFSLPSSRSSFFAIEEAKGKRSHKAFRILHT